MLKNKFGMLKSVALVMVLLMIVAVFAACGKQDDVDVDAAISAALAEQSKAQAEKDAELSKQLAEQSKKAEEDAAKLSSQLAEQSKRNDEESKRVSEELSKAQTTSKAPATTTTTTKAPETTPAPEDVSSQVAELSALREKYQYAYANYYVDDNFAKALKILDVAAMQLSNAKTVAAAKDIVAQATVDLEAIPNAQSAATAFKAQVTALGDIESEVFTTAAAKVTAADKALATLKKTYKAYIASDAKWDEKLGISTAVAELAKADAKIEAIEAFVTESLQEDMKALYDATNKKVSTPKDYTAEIKDDVTIGDTVKSAYYKYQVLAVVNGGDVADADLAVAWDYKYDENGKVVKDDEGNKVIDYKKPTTYFTVEELMDTYILPWAENEFEATKKAWIDFLSDRKTGLITDEKIYDLIKGSIGTLKFAGAEAYDADKLFGETYKDIDIDIEDYADDFEDELDALSYVDDYKANNTLDAAKADLFLRGVKAYAKAVAAAVPAFEKAAAEKVKEDIEEAIDELDEDDKSYDRQLQNLKNKLIAAVARIDAITSYTLEEMSSDTVHAAYRKFIGAEKNDKVPTVADLIEATKDYTPADKEDWAKIKTQIVKISAMGIANALNGVSVSSAGETPIDTTDLEYAELVSTLIDHLRELQEEFMLEDGKYYDKYKGSASYSIITDETTYANAAKLAAIATEIDQVIADLAAIQVADYTDKQITVLNPTKDLKYNGSKTAMDKAIYFKDAAAKKYAEDNGLTTTDLYNSDLYRTQLLTATKTDYPVTYTQTAAEQAIMAAQAAYKKAYENWGATLLGFKDYVNSATKKLNDNATVKSMKNLVAGNAALNAEYTNLVNYYLEQIGKLKVSAPAYAEKNDYMNTEDHITMPDVAKRMAQNMDELLDAVNNKALAWYKLCTGDTEVTQDPEKLLKPKSNAIENQWKFNLTKITNLYDLWDYKSEQVAKVNEIIKQAKNSYTMVASSTIGTVATDIKVIAAYTDYFKYDYDESKIEVDGKIVTGDDLVALKIQPSVKAIAYEAALDALATEYTAKIMAITMDNSNAAAITDWSGYNQYKAKDKPCAYNYTDTKKVINAYVQQAIGTKNVETVYLKNTTTVVYTRDGGRCDSAIFKAYFDQFASKYIYNEKIAVANDKVFTITFKYKDAAGEDQKIEKKVNYGEKLTDVPTIPAEAVKEGYTAAWNADELAKATDNSVFGAITVNIAYTENPDSPAE